MDINKTLANLMQYAVTALHLDPRDKNVALNAVMDALKLESVTECASSAEYAAPDALLDEIIDYAVSNHVIEEWEQEALTDRIMSALCLKPSEIDAKFHAELKKSGKAAMDWLYSYSVKNAYVKRAKLDKNPRFDVNGLTVTINKSKPEFRDPNKAKAGNSVKGGYPKCVICRENEGYAPRSKRTLTTVSLKLNGDDFFWQYSPYGYFHEHGIAVNCSHIPMYVDKGTFYRLMDFVDMFPHYFIGCNAALPRIGGSVLAHDHYQGGGEILPLHKAGIKKYLKDDEYKDVKIGILDWPGTVVRIASADRDAIAAIAEKIRVKWVAYNNEALGIIAEDKDGVHNAVSPTVVRTKTGYEMNIILRSNITSERYPDGVFHAHPEFHEIKKESIGLIEAQGLFILPGRLESELAQVEECMGSGKLLPELERFRLVYDEAKAIYDKNKKRGTHPAMQEELGSICYRILENTAVFKDDAHTIAFLKEVGLHE